LFFEFNCHLYLKKSAIVCIKNGKDNVPIEDTCLKKEHQILSEIGTLSLTFVMLFDVFCAIEYLLQNIHIKNNALRVALYIMLP
jgi:hypothetical protein